ncbi:MurR/RpiR family transcriptional regulator [Crossiella sp. NPDC003009]
MSAGSSEADDFEGWLRGRVPERGLQAKAAAVLETLLAQPRRASYSSAAELAELAGANVATVIRTAQALGFSGWPTLQQELRARYLSALSAPEVAAEHADAVVTGSPASASLRRDLDNVALLTRSVDIAAARELAAAIGQARRTVVVAAGSYTSVGIALAHNAQLAGYDTQLAAGYGGGGPANTIAQLTGQDVLVVVSFWRLNESAVVAAEEAAAKGARVFVITDAASPALATAAERILLVPTEGISFFPSLTAAMALVQAVVAELAMLDPGRTKAAVEAAEAQWARFGLLHRPTRRGRT